MHFDMKISELHTKFSTPYTQISMKVRKKCSISKTSYNINPVEEKSEIEVIEIVLFFSVIF